jgi:hypothetical protein
VEEPKVQTVQLPLWARIVATLLALILAIESLSKHGFRNWDWIEPLAIAGVIAFPAKKRDPFDRNLHWLLRTLLLLWIVAFVAWIAHTWGWIPASCLAVIALVPTRRGKSSLHARSLISYTAIGVGFMWLAYQTKAWAPLLCVTVAALLITHERPGRRSLKENLWRPSSAVWTLSAAIALFWALKEATMGPIAAFTAIVILWSGNLLLHLSLSSNEDPLALSHPQS